KERPALAAKTRFETRRAASLSSGQEDDCFGSPGAERPGGSSEPGSRIQSKIRAQSHQPLATGARLCGQPEGTRNRRPDLRSSQAAGMDVSINQNLLGHTVA